MAVRKLSELKTGEKGIIQRISGTGRFRQRLMEMGFVPGAEIRVERFAPLRNPIEYVLKGYHVSLRRDEAEKVIVQQPEGETRGD